MTARRFELHRDVDVTGISGTGVVAEGIEFTDGVVALRWRSEWPISVVFHDKGLAAVYAVHGHGGSTRAVMLDEAQLVIVDLVRTCPSCGTAEAGEPYDIGDGPEFCCRSCDWCWGALGQRLTPVRPDEVRRG